jgi:hypothetical protein
VATLQIRTPDVGTGGVPWHPETEEERQAISGQLLRLVSSPFFRNSRRYPNLLRYTVERALEGGTDHLKERTLGVDVFGRAPDYDTNIDPVVRITAVEVRKRIAQYYREPGREKEIRIDFPAGSYVPEFRKPSTESAQESAVVVPPLETRTSFTTARSEEPSRTLPVSRNWRLWGLAALGLIASAAGASLLHVGTQKDVLDEFWGPVIKARGAVLICVGGDRVESQVPPAVGHEMTVHELMHEDQIALSDATAMTLVSGLFKSKDKPFRIRRAARMALADLREGPVVLVGAFNNSWSMRLAEPMRFHFQRLPGHNLAIVDRQNASRVWSVDPGMTISSFPEDYALVSRVLDPATGHLVIMLGGITRYGTSAAGEFVTESSYIHDLIQSAPGSWKGGNFQAVIAAKVVGENSGPPRVLATYFW